MSAVIEVFMPDQTVRTFSEATEEMNQAFLAGGVPIQRLPNGQHVHTYRLSQLLGGWLLDNCPTNVVLGKGWLPGQIDALKAAGLTPSCPECIPGSVCATAYGIAALPGAAAAPTAVPGGASLPSITAGPSPMILSGGSPAPGMSVPMSPGPAVASIASPGLASIPTWAWIGGFVILFFYVTRKGGL